MYIPIDQIVIWGLLLALYGMIAGQFFTRFMFRLPPWGELPESVIHRLNYQIRQLERKLEERNDENLTKKEK